MSDAWNPARFIDKWSRAELSERAASHEHFIDLCRLLGQPTPAEHDATGAEYTFEKGVRVTAAASRGSAGESGFADVWWRGKFAWEYKRKGKYKDLAEAYRQLCQYREALENPPLLIVSDIARTEIHTNFTGTSKEVHAIALAELDRPENLDRLRRVFTDPESFKPTLTTAAITEEAAGEFARIAEGLRDRRHDPHTAAHFLMKCMFCLFAEDVGLLPAQLFTRLLARNKYRPDNLTQRLTELFDHMRTGGDFGADEIAFFNGGLFDRQPALELRTGEIEAMQRAARHDWGAVEPAIFGTLFERSLDPDKRAQIGAHYTSRDDIMLIVEPVVMQPLRSEWDAVRAECDALYAKVKAGARRAMGARGRAVRQSPALTALEKKIDSFVDRLAGVRILDPACGSGNFLYVAIQQLLGLEKEVLTYAAGVGVGLIPRVRPTQLHGIEINPYAAELAQVVIWIGYLQWKRDNGYAVPRDPILSPLQTIECRDAILAWQDQCGHAIPIHHDGAKCAGPAEWPEADFVIGNPPFLGSKLFRASGLSDTYIDAMFRAWKDRVPHPADLCCYWFEKARELIQRRNLQRAGLLATQGIRGGANRQVLKRIKETGDIFFAVSDRDWILDGANVHVSMIAFDDGSQTHRELDGASVAHINPDLTSATDLTSAVRLDANAGIAFMGDTKGGAFDVSGEQAATWLAAPNASGKPNRDVLRPWVNGRDLTERNRGMWIIDFGCDMPLSEAAQYEQPFEYVRRHVKPARDQNKRDSYRENWWIHVEPRPAMRKALGTLRRMIATPNLTKHRLFCFLDCSVLPDHQLIVFARDDDYFFGVLHSVLHERWSLRMGTALEDRPRYTPTTCFETFPFPPLAGGIARNVPHNADFAGAPADYDAARASAMRERIAACAARLNELRENWLNPMNPDGAPALDSAQLKKRTLTNLYNKRPTWLELAHLNLDRAVLAAYGWPEGLAETLAPRRDPAGKANPILGTVGPSGGQRLLTLLMQLNTTIREEHARRPRQ